MTVPIAVSSLDPNCVLQGISRAMVGAVKFGAVTYDVQYGEFARWIWVGAAGDLAFQAWDGTTVFIPGLAAGLYPFCSIQIFGSEAGTTIPADVILWAS
jgi:hypothetical protein